MKYIFVLSRLHVKAIGGLRAYGPKARKIAWGGHPFMAGAKHRGLAGGCPSNRRGTSQKPHLGRLRPSKFKKNCCLQPCDYRVGHFAAGGFSA